MRSDVRLSLSRALFPAILIQVAVSTQLQAATFTVANVNDSGSGSLRAAISNANAIAGIDLVDFNLPGTSPFTINLSTVLPSITEPVTIDATTQTGYADKPLIELDGNVAAGNGTGIYLLTSNCVIRGLAISRFSREAIRIEGQGGNTIQANFIGTGPFGTNTLGNGPGGPGFGGITVVAANNLIGGTNSADRNLISGGNKHGVVIQNATAISNSVIGNYLGTDITGTKRLGNLNNGVLFMTGAKWNVIGGTNAGSRNLISGNGQSGVYINDAATVSNQVQGNFIGTDLTGTLSVSNVADGVTIGNGSGNLIGGTAAAARNVISGNGGRAVLVSLGSAHDNRVEGNYLGTDVTGTSRVANAFSGVEIQNASTNYIGGATAGAGNLISGNTASGVYINGASAVANVIAGNYIGVSVSGSQGLGNGSHGVFLASGAKGNLVGGNTTAARNLISGNGQNGIYLADAGTVANQVAGNYIGTDSTGNSRLGNALSGVRIEAPLNMIGGTSAAERNVISGNTNGHGVFINGSLATSNTVAANFIGTTAAGNGAVKNGNINDYSGIYLQNAAANQIGGTDASMRNLISGNADKGIIIYGLAATRNVVQGNYIGTTASGDAAIGSGNPNGGIFLYGSPSNTIGGAVSGAGNLISGNGADAIRFGDLNPGGAGANFNVIQGNKIGTKSDGVGALGNLFHGINFDNGSSNNIVGGTTPTTWNIIANALSIGYDGVRIRDGTRGNQVRGNSIYSNGNSSANGLGIDLNATDGVNANDNCDIDGAASANYLQNFPNLSNAVSSASVTVVRGSLNSTASTSFLLQFYANANLEPSGHGEGQTYLGETTVTTSAGCTTNFSVLLTNIATVGQRVSATATDAAGNTSEFGPAIAVVPQPTLGLILSNTPPAVTLRWTNLATGFELLQTPSLSPPIVWTAVTNVPTSGGGFFAVTLAPTNGSRFYRLALP